MAKATKQELETAKAKAIKGGMPQEVADKVIQMAGSKGEFAMQLNKQKNNSADNFSYKDATTMMQSALYNPGHGGEPNHTHTNVPSYDTTNISATSGVSGNSSSKSSSGTGVSYSEAYKKADKNKYPTLESFTEAAKSYNKKQNSNSGNKSTSRNITSSTKTTQLGNQSSSDVELEGITAEQNRKNKAKAFKEYTQILSEKDSARVTNQAMDKLSIADQLNTTSKGYIDAVLSGNRAGRETLRSSGAFTDAEIDRMFVKGIKSDDKDRYYEDRHTAGFIQGGITGKSGNGSFGDSRSSKQDDYNTIYRNTNPGTSGSFGQNNPTRQKAFKDFQEQNRKSSRNLVDIHSVLNMKPLKMSYGMKNKK